MIYLIIYTTGTIEARRHLAPMKRAELEGVAGADLRMVKREDRLALVYSGAARELNPVNLPFAERNYPGIVIVGRYRNNRLCGFENLEEAEKLLLQKLS